MARPGNGTGIMYRIVSNKNLLPIKPDKKMRGFKVITKERLEIYFTFYLDEAPVTCRAFQDILPFTRLFYHARVSGKEIWINDVPPRDIIQENASVFVNRERLSLVQQNRPGLKRPIVLGYIMEKEEAWMQRIYLHASLMPTWKNWKSWEILFGKMVPSN